MENSQDETEPASTEEKQQPTDDEMMNQFTQG
jgi:hypothetical protein